VTTPVDTNCWTASSAVGAFNFDSTLSRSISACFFVMAPSPLLDYGGFYSITYTTNNYSYDQMERPVGMTDAASGNAYVSGVQYGPANQMLQISYTPTAGGTLLTETRTYNSLLQLTGINTGSVNLTYNYTAGQDNGKIASATNNVSGEQVVYTYDTLNRLIQAQTVSNPNVPQWGQAFVYDGFGNLYQKNATPQGPAPTMNLNVDPATNRLLHTGSPPFVYDNNGNVLSGPNVGPLSYDFLNRVVVNGTVSGQNTQYAYDAANRRVWKGALSGGTLQTEAYYLYDIDGTNVGTYTPSVTVLNNEYGLYQYQILGLTLAQSRQYFFGKKLFATEDSVGSAASTGTFYPFGEQKSGTAANEQYKFATYWRDGESGLDYAGSRFYSSTLGRFLSADQYQANTGGPGDPQSWNRYAYAGGDPVNRLDPSGLMSCEGGGEGGPPGLLCDPDPGDGGPPPRPNPDPPDPSGPRGNGEKSKFPRCNPTDNAVTEYKLNFIAALYTGAIAEADVIAVALNNGVDFNSLAQTFIEWSASETQWGQDTLYTVNHNDLGQQPGSWGGTSIPCSAGARPTDACFAASLGFQQQLASALAQVPSNTTTNPNGESYLQALENVLQQSPDAGTAPLLQAIASLGFNTFNSNYGGTVVRNTVDPSVNITGTVPGLMDCLQKYGYVH
jgi:RHS repeat-associated protein